MASRKIRTIAEEAKKCFDIINDLFDTISFNCRYQNENGGTLLVNDPINNIKTPATRADVIDLVKQRLQTIKVYSDASKIYRSKLEVADLLAAINLLDMTITELDQEISDYKTEYDWIEIAIDNVTSDSQLTAIADRIDTNIEKLPILRKAWAL